MGVAAIVHEVAGVFPGAFTESFRKTKYVTKSCRGVSGETRSG